MIERIKQYQDFKIEQRSKFVKLNSPLPVEDTIYWVDLRKNKTRTIKNNLASGNLPVNSSIIPGTGRSLLHQGIIFNKIELFTLALLYNADVNLQSIEGTTALHIACSLNRQQMVQALLEKGSRLDILDQDGYTAMQRAEFYEHHNICEQLQEHINNQ